MYICVVYAYCISSGAGKELSAGKGLSELSKELFAANRILLNCLTF